MKLASLNLVNVTQMKNLNFFLAHFMQLVAPLKVLKDKAKQDVEISKSNCVGVIFP